VSPLIASEGAGYTRRNYLPRPEEIHLGIFWLGRSSQDKVLPNVDAAWRSSPLPLSALPRCRGLTPCPQLAAVQQPAPAPIPAANSTRLRECAPKSFKMQTIAHCQVSLLACPRSVNMLHFTHRHLKTSEPVSCAMPITLRQDGHFPVTHKFVRL